MDRYTGGTVNGALFTQHDFGKQWDEWMEGDKFTLMKQEVGAAPFDNDTLGLMTMRGDMTGFTYWIGLFFPADTKVPSGYNFRPA